MATINSIEFIIDGRELWDVEYSRNVAYPIPDVGDIVTLRVDYLDDRERTYRVKERSFLYFDVLARGDVRREGSSVRIILERV